MVKHRFMPKIKTAKSSPTNDPRSEWGEWNRKGATLSDKTAFKEYGLTEKEIIQAIRAGKLQYRENSIYGSPFLRLLRREVELLLKKDRGADFLRDQRLRTELKRINRQIRQHKTQITALEKDRSRMLEENVQNASANKKLAKRNGRDGVEPNRGKNERSWQKRTVSLR